MLMCLLPLTLTVALLAACAPSRHVPAMSSVDTNQARAEFECQQLFQRHLVQLQAVNPYGDLEAFKKSTFMKDCMRGHGYGVAE